MTNVIIGHTTHRSARIWVRGERSRPFVYLKLRAADAARDSAPERRLRLSADNDYTGCAEFDDLSPSTGYEVQLSAASFADEARGRRRDQGAVGRFHTAPEPRGADRAWRAREPPLRFLLGSCNLSSVRVDNLLALLAGFSGLVATKKALLRTDSAPFRSPSLWRRFLSLAASFLLHLVYKRTAFRQPPPHRLVSPFLRLSALFGTLEATFEEGRTRPRVGAFVVGEQSNARAAVAIDPIVEDGEWTTDEGRATGTLCLVPINDIAFVRGEKLLLEEPIPGAAAARDGGAIVCRVTGLKKHGGRPPAFMLHVGDQIYFDFPRAASPEARSYRSAYREAWIEDRIAAHFLAQCAQYMTMDDHEIYNNFSRDGRIADEPGQRSKKPRPEMGQYFEPAIRAYREYVHSRHPGLGLKTDAHCDTCKRALGDENALYYCFAFGDRAHFFVLDTRSERYEQRGQMISCCQMSALKQWLDEHREHLVFIVSSVPFVPHIYATADETRVGHEPANRSVDKWCAAAFCRQRDEIARHIWQRKISRAIFLTGDMHCCYYATMRVGDPSDAVTIHELCAGPIYQLTLADPRHFYEQYRGNLGGGDARLPYVSRMRQHYSAANAVMEIQVEPPVPVSGREGQAREACTQNVRWNVIATISGHGECRTVEPVVSGRVALHW